MNAQFENQVGIIAGAASGPGSTITLKLSGKGLKLALVDKGRKNLKKIKLFLSDEREIYSMADGIQRLELVVSHNAESIDKVLQRVQSVCRLLKLTCNGLIYIGYAPEINSPIPKNLLFFL